MRKILRAIALVLCVGCCVAWLGGDNAAIAAAKKSSAKTSTKSSANAKPTPSAKASRMQDLFWKRSWQEMEALYKQGGNFTAQDHALMANAYRFQNKWPEALAILNQHMKDFPASVKPYANMTLLRGYEQTGRKDEALRIAENMWKDAPQDLKYYVAYAQYRLLNESTNKNNAALERALTRMLQNAGTDDRKIFTLTRLIALPGDRTKQALQLINLQPSNKSAAAVLAKHKTPWPAEVRVALGVYSYLAGDNEQAVERLAPVALKTTGGRKAAYYRAWSLYKLKKYTEALNLWGQLAISGNSWAESSVRRIATLASNSDAEHRKSALAVLERVAKERVGKVQARALLALVDLYSKDQSQAKHKEALEAQILKAYPDTSYAFNVLWRRGWANMNANKPAEAVKLWKQADAPNTSYWQRARILYWLAQAQKLAGQTAESSKTLDLLMRKYPVTIYATLASRATGRQFKIVDGYNPALDLKPSELEQWGFIVYARLKLARPKATAKELYRALKLSRWLGLEESYSEARRIETMLTTGTTLYRGDLEALYPRPFKQQVEAACQQYGVEDNFVWAIMKQESGFKANAGSHAGASGLMQLMPGTAKDESKRAGLATYDIMNVGDNIKLGTSHLATLAKSFSRKDWIMAAYNAGSGNARKWMKNGGDKFDTVRWIEAIRFEETCGYVQRVGANLEIYRMLYANDKK